MSDTGPAPPAGISPPPGPPPWPRRADLEATIRFAALNAIVQRAHQYGPDVCDRAETIARDIARELMKPSFRWTLAETID